MKDVKSIEFIFENCEHFSIDAKYFGALELTNFNTHIQRVASNAITKMSCVGTVAMEIFSEGDGKYSCFGDEDLTKFERLKNWNDITALTVVYEDDSEETYYVNYEEEYLLGSPNALQRSKTNKFGDLYIIISESKCFTDFFDDEEINNKEHMEFAKDMIFRLEEKL